MNLSELNNLNFNGAGSWPLPFKGVAYALVFTAGLGFGYWFDIRDQRQALTKVETEEKELRITFEEKQKKAANLDAYKAQLKEMEVSFGELLRQLPSKAEVADLLVDISQAGLASGLEFDLFKPGAEILKEFYAELPIKIQVRGSYHEFGEFVSGVAALPRIVTLHDISIKRAGKDSDQLTLELTANTYRYLEEEEQK
jgi:Tfp pilus assembly protein PilO